MMLHICEPLEEPKRLAYCVIGNEVMSHDLAHGCQAQHTPLRRADIAIIVFLVRNEILAFEIL